MITVFLIEMAWCVCVHVHTCTHMYVLLWIWLLMCQDLLAYHPVFNFLSSAQSSSTFPRYFLELGVTLWLSSSHRYVIRVRYHSHAFPSPWQLSHLSSSLPFTPLDWYKSVLKSENCKIERAWVPALFCVWKSPANIETPLWNSEKNNNLLCWICITSWGLLIKETRNIHH